MKKQLFFITFKVKPFAGIKELENIDGAYGIYICASYDANAAVAHLQFTLSKYGYVLDEINYGPSFCTNETFLNNSLPLKIYEEAKETGESLFLSAWTNDGTTFEEPIKMKRITDVNPQEHIKNLKNSRSRGRCLHFEAGARCNTYIEAHSIQKNGVLSLVSRNGKVYSPNKSYGVIDEKNPNPVFTLQGVNKVSTFRGFCKYHDNIVFQSIDDNPFQNKRSQAALYHYRSVCREYFHKENALRASMLNLDNHNGTELEIKFMKMNIFGYKLGLKIFSFHKKEIEKSLETADY